MKEQYVLVTGASQGIGYAIARKLAESNPVIGVGLKKPQDFPGDFFECDFSKKEELEAFIKKISQQYRFNALINNAGIVIEEALVEVKRESLEEIFQVNFFAHVLLTKELITGMQEQKQGTIINISSRNILGEEGLTCYSASKAAISCSTRTWAIELSKYNINVNAIAPGAIATNMMREFLPEGSDEEKEFISRIPLKRVGQVEDVANLVDFLCSEKGNYITGQTIFVDGGLSLGSSSY